MSDPDTASESRHREGKRKRVTQVIVRVVLLFGIAAIAVVGFTVYQAMQVRDALNEANRHFEELTTAVAAGDTAAAQKSLYAAQRATLTAQRNTGGPVWWLASKPPLLGDDVTAVRTVTDVVDDVAQGVLPTLVDASASLSPGDLQPSNGLIRLDNIQRVAPLLVTAHDSLADDLARVRSLQTDTLMSQIATPVSQLEAKLAEASSVTATASRAAELLPTMLGADGIRTYLVLFQNNAEIRATGGIPGAVATITADQGAISLQQQGSASALGTYTKPVLRLTREEQALFTSKLAVFPADVTFTPDFPRTAQLAQEMWRRATGVTVDGVLSTDPVALSYLLAGTGPISVTADQELTADNAVQLLLNQIYLDQSDLDLQNAFFADAARSVFEGVMSGQGDPGIVLDGIRRAADEHRTLVWSDDAREQALLAPTVLAGALPTEPTTSPQVGVYLNDGTGSKMDYYLDYDVTVASTSCDASDAQSLEVTVTMASKAPADAASLPVSVKGPGFGAKPGSIRTNVLVYAPVGGRIEKKPTIDGKALISAPFTYRGRQVAAQTIDLQPGQSHRLSFTLTSGANQPGTPDLRITPGVPGSGTTEVAESACQ